MLLLVGGAKLLLLATREHLARLRKELLLFLLQVVLDPVHQLAHGLQPFCRAGIGLLQLFHHFVHLMVLGDAVAGRVNRFVMLEQGHVEAALLRGFVRGQFGLQRLEDLPAFARFVDPHTVECENGTRLQARRFLIATGGRPSRPAVPGAELGGVSDDFFQWRAAPERVAIVGGGYIAAELAGLLQALGSRVEMFVRGSRLLKGFDHELVEELLEDYRQQGIRVHLDYTLAAVERDGDGVRLRHIDGALGERFDALLFATPEYNGFPTPLVINAFDWLSRLKDGLAVTANKPVALVSSSPGALGGLRSMNFLRQYLQMAFQMLVLPAQQAVGRAHEAFAPDGTLADARAAATLDGVVKALLREAALRRG